MQTGTTDGPRVCGCVPITLAAWIILAVAFPVVFGLLVYVAFAFGVSMFIVHQRGSGDYRGRLSLIVGSSVRHDDRRRGLCDDGRAPIGPMIVFPQTLQCVVAREGEIT